LVAASPTGQSPDLTFSLNLNKSAFNAGETIQCNIMLKNTSSKDIVVNKRFLVNYPGGPHEVWLEIIGPNLKQIPFVIKINAEPGTGVFTLLKASQSVSGSYPLTNQFELAGPGRYSIKAYYENQVDPNSSTGLKTAWKGSLVSEKLNFTIR